MALLLVLWSPSVGAFDEPADGLQGELGLEKSSDEHQSENPDPSGSLDGWEPGQGEKNPQTRIGPSFGGLRYFLPVRLHLSRGGFVEGGMGGVDSDSSQLLLVQGPWTLNVDLDLVTAVTPLEKERSGDANEDALPMLSLESAGRSVAARKRIPKERVGAGLLSILLPGLGQWVAGEDPRLGLALFISDLFLLAGGFLAVFATPQSQPSQRVVVGTVFFGASVGLRIGAGAQGFVGSGPPRAP